MIDADKLMGEPEYPGLEFKPPMGAIGPDELEGDALVRWKKVGDRYTIILFEGKKMIPSDEEMHSEDVEKIKGEKTKASSLKELDMIGFLA